MRVVGVRMLPNGRARVTGLTDDNRTVVVTVAAPMVGTATVERLLVAAARRTALPLSARRKLQEPPTPQEPPA